MNYFCYERNFSNRWQPIVYHGEKPPKSVNNSDPERTPFYEIPIELLGSDGVSPKFSELQRRFPV